MADRGIRSVLSGAPCMGLRARANEQDEQSMRAKLLQAITSGAGFDLS